MAKKRQIGTKTYQFLTVSRKKKSMVILFPFIRKGRKLPVSHKMTKSLTVICKALTPMRPSATKVIMLLK